MSGLAVRAWWEDPALPRKETRGSVEDPNTPLTMTQLAEVLSAGFRSDAGPVVSAESAMRQATVYRCVSLLGGSLGQLPCLAYERTERGRRKAKDRPEYELVHQAPNPEQTPMIWKETGQAHLCLRGNAYSRIAMTYGGRPLALWPLLPDRVQVERKGGRLVYHVTLNDGTHEDLAPEEVIHVPALSMNGIVGMNPIEALRQSVGISMAAESVAAKLFSEGIRGSGILIAKNGLEPDAAELLRLQFQKIYAGNLHHALIVGGDADWKPLTINPDDAQFLETRKFQVAEIARIFGIPPHMIGDVEKSTSWGTGIEQQGIGFVVYVLAPWLVRWEQELERKLFAKADRASYYIKFNADGLLRGDMKTRYEAYQIGVMNGWLTPNNVLEKEEMETFEGGDVHRAPLNTAPLEPGAEEAEAA